MAALSLRAVKISSLALAGPISRGSRCVPPAPGMMPRAHSVSPIFASLPSTRRSHDSASSQPPPNATPSTAAMVGMGRRSTRSMMPLMRRKKARTSVGDMVARSFRSVGYSGVSNRAARYFRIAELSVTRKSPSASAGTVLFGLIAA